jgi:hypothetical protein
MVEVWLFQSKHGLEHDHSTYSMIFRVNGDPPFYTFLASTSLLLRGCDYQGTLLYINIARDGSSHQGPWPPYTGRRYSQFLCHQQSSSQYTKALPMRVCTLLRGVIALSEIAITQWWVHGNFNLCCHANVSCRFYRGQLQLKLCWTLSTSRRYMLLLKWCCAKMIVTLSKRQGHFHDRKMINLERRDQRHS